eukprot:365527-Chlamydomonas_euryale.AAC.7
MSCRQRRDDAPTRHRFNSQASRRGARSPPPRPLPQPRAVWAGIASERTRGAVGAILDTTSSAPWLARTYACTFSGSTCMGSRVRGPPVRLGQHANLLLAIAETIR